MAQSSAATIYVLNGPNLNMLGIREPEKYGHASLADVEKLCVETAAQFGLKADCRQSNREGELIDFIHEAHARRWSASSSTPAAIRTPRSRCTTRWSR
jgi:3-dehydroquinate dehydratase-2